MFEIISALWPVFALILLGYIARRVDFPGESFWVQAEKATYFVLFPVLLVYKLSMADMSSVELDIIGIAVVSLVAFGSVAAFLFKPLISGSATGFTSVYQGSVRFNTYVGLAASAALFGSQGVAIAAVIMAIMIPLLNLCCVLVFAIFTHKAGGAVNAILVIVKNPLIIGSLVGLILNQTGVGLPSLVEPVAELLSRMALPLGLLAVGAGLSFKVLRDSGKELIGSSVIKLLLMPLASVGIAHVLNLDVLSAQLILLYAALPTATSAYILARQLGGNAPMMAAIITGQTLLSMLSMPLVLILLTQL
ncbi:MAG: AEC family transporter [Neptuniibacter sp.]